LKTNPSSPPFTKGRNYPSLAKRGKGRFSKQYVFSIMDFLSKSQIIKSFGIKDDPLLSLTYDTKVIFRLLNTPFKIPVK
jgi:hypothetical protein